MPWDSLHLSCAIAVTGTCRWRLLILFLAQIFGRSTAIESKLAYLNIIASTWLWNPNLPAKLWQQALLTSPVKYTRQFPDCGQSLSGAMTALACEKKIGSLAHSISLRCWSYRKCLAFINPVGNVIIFSGVPTSQHDCLFPFLWTLAFSLAKYNNNNNVFL